MKGAARGLAVALLLAGCVANQLDPDPYRAAIGHAASLETKKYSEIVSRSLNGSMWHWERDPVYRKMRETARRLSLETQVQLEIGNQNKGSYEVIRLGQSNGDPIALFRLGQSSVVEMRHLDDKSARVIYERAVALSARFDTCKSSLSLSDASAYFGTVEADGKSRRFAVYGLNFFPSINKEQEQEALAMAPCRDFVSLIFQAIGRSSVPVVVGLESGG